MIFGRDPVGGKFQSRAAILTGRWGVGCRHASDHVLIQDDSERMSKLLGNATCPS